jgi:hypothetical protein
MFFSIFMTTGNNKKASAMPDEYHCGPMLRGIYPMSTTRRATV